MKLTKKIDKKISAEYPISTIDGINLFSNHEEITDGKLDSFTFPLARVKHKYINGIGDYIESKIPSFFDIWPYLGAYTIGGHYDTNLDESLLTIGVGHYTILKSLSYIIKNKGSVCMNDVDQKYKNIILHFAIIIDCIKQISFHILKFKNKLNPDPNYPIKQLTEIELEEKLKKFSYKNYLESFKKYKKYGVSITIPLQPENEFIALLYPPRDRINSYYSFKGRIDPIRNLYIHNPAIDIYHKKGKGFLVAKNNRSRTIQTILNIPDKESENPVVFIEELFMEATKMLADVWAIFYEEIKKINNNSEFKSKIYKNDLSGEFRGML